MSLELISGEVMEYCANSLWLTPLLAGSAWMLVRLTRPRVGIEHRVWLVVLALAVVAPLRGISTVSGEQRVVVTAASAGMDSAATGFTATDRGVVRASDVAFSDAAEPVGPSVVEAGTIPPSRSAGLGARMLAELLWWRRAGRVPLSPVAAGVLLWVYLVTVVVGLLRLANGMLAANRLARGAEPVHGDERESAVVEEYCRKLGIRRPRLSVSSEIESPVVVGVLRPHLLLPAAFAEYSEGQARAVLGHELAHVRRADSLGNFICRLGGLPIAYHPAAGWVQRRIRQTREMICDEMAAAGMDSRTGYARCLVDLARQMAGRRWDEEVQAVGLFDNNELEERIVRLTEMKRVSTMGGMRLAGGFAVGVFVVVVAGTFHLTTARAAYQAPIQMAMSGDGLPVLPAVAGSPVVLAGSSDDSSSAEEKVDSKAEPPAVTSDDAGQDVVVLPRVASRPLEHLEPLEHLDAMQVAQDLKRLDRGSGKVSADSKAMGFQVQGDTSTDDKVHVDVRVRSDDAVKVNADQLARQMDDVRRQVAIAKMDLRIDPQVKMQMDTTVKKWDGKDWDEARVKHDVESATKVANDFRFDDAKFKKEMEDAERKIREEMARINSPEFQKQITDATKLINSPEFKKNMEDARRRAEEAAKQLDDPAFKQRMVDMQKQMAEMSKQINSGEMARQLDAASKELHDAAERLREKASSPSVK